MPIPRVKSEDDPSKHSPSETITIQLRHVCLEYSYKQLETATDGFHESRRLGSGSAGSVYRAELPDGSFGAVKCIDLQALGDSAVVAGFEDEVMILSKFRHPNLVVLMGWAKEGNKRFLLYEFLSGGDLAGRLQKSKSNRLPFMWHERLAVLRDAATGLAHLQNATPRAFHRDIKSPNILLGQSGAKMADFGLSCVAKTRTCAAVDCEFKSGTPGYACPIYLWTGKATAGSEAFSFGMVVLETLTNLMPAGMVGEEVKYPIQDALQPQSPGFTERAVAHADSAAGWPPPVAAALATMAFDCINSDEAARPSFNDICHKLRALQNQYPPSCVLGAPPGWPGVHGGAAMQPPHFAPRQGMPVPAMTGWSPLGQPAGQQFPPLPTGLSGLSGFSNPAMVQLATTGSGIPPPPGGPIAPPLAEVALEITQVRCAPLSSIRPELRMLPLQPSINADGKRVARFGRVHQPHWFEAVVLDSSDWSCISRDACELSWGGANLASSRVKLCVLGSGVLLVDDAVVPRGGSVEIGPGTRICLAKQLPQGLEPIISLAVHCAASPSQNEGLPEKGGVAQMPTVPSLGQESNSLEFGSVPAERRPLSLEADESLPSEGFQSSQPARDAWRLECVFAAGVAPEAFAALPLCARQVSFQISPGTPSKNIGREHQADFFAALLYHEPSLLEKVSRSHFRLDPLEKGVDGPKITNLSPNIAIVAQRPLQQGQSAIVLDGDTISFTHAAPAEVVADGNQGSETHEAASAEPFLTFRLVAPPPPAAPTPFAMLSMPSLSAISVMAHPPKRSDDLPEKPAAKLLLEEVPEEAQPPKGSDNSPEKPAAKLVLEEVPEDDIRQDAQNLDHNPDAQATAERPERNLSEDNSMTLPASPSSTEGIVAEVPISTKPSMTMHRRMRETFTHHLPRQEGESDAPPLAIPIAQSVRPPASDATDKQPTNDAADNCIVM